MVRKCILLNLFVWILLLCATRSLLSWITVSVAITVTIFIWEDILEPQWKWEYNSFVISQFCSWGFRSKQSTVWPAVFHRPRAERLGWNKLYDCLFSKTWRFNKIMIGFIDLLYSVLVYFNLSTIYPSSFYPLLLPVSQYFYFI